MTAMTSNRSVSEMVERARAVSRELNAHGDKDDAAAIDVLLAVASQAQSLREALTPFARAADIKLCGKWHDNEFFAQTDVGFYLTFGDLRKARATLNESSAIGGGDGR